MYPWQCVILGIVFCLQTKLARAKFQHKLCHLLAVFRPALACFLDEVLLPLLIQAMDKKSPEQPFQPSFSRTQTTNNNKQ